MFHFMAENLKVQYRECADAVRQGSGAHGSNQLSSTIFQYGDWFDRYPHGVSQSDFEEAAVGIKKEKGDDAVLEQKTDYSTVEDLFQTLSPLNPQDRESAKPAKRKNTKKSVPPSQQQPEVLQMNLQNMAPDPVMQIPNNHHHMAPTYDQMSPTNTTNMFGQNQYYNQDLLLPPHHQGLLPQLDRQLVFGAYGGMDPSLGGTQNMLEQSHTNSWDLGMGGMTGFVTEPSSAWFMPFNMEPPEIGQDADIFNTMGGGGAGAGYGLGGIQQVNEGGNGGHRMPRSSG